MSREYHPTLHVREEDLSEADSRCPFCLSEDRTETVAIQSEPDVSLLACGKCHAMSVSRMPRLEYLRDVYYPRYYESFSAEKVTFDFPDRLANHILGRTLVARGLTPPPSPRVLDFGGGDGSVALAVARQLLTAGAESVDVRVIDFHAGKRPDVNQKIVWSAAETLADIEPESADLVIASAIVEHLPEPREALSALFGAVAGGGWFYARTPWVVPFRLFVRSLLRSRRPLDIGFPGHLHDLGEPFWRDFIPMLSGGKMRVARSAPAIPQTSILRRPVRAPISYIFKAPWWVLGKHWRWVGGWEVFARCRAGDPN